MSLRERHWLRAMDVNLNGFMVGANLVMDGGVTAGTGHPNSLRTFDAT